LFYDGRDFATLMMTRPAIRAAAFGIGVVAGLRSLTAPAIVAWAAERKYLRPRFPLAGLLTHKLSRKMIKLAAGELLADKLPFTPKRINAGPLAARIASGAACGAALSYALEGDWQPGAMLGAAGATAGAFGGYYARKSLSRSNSPLAVALLEDAVAVGSGIALIARVNRDL
jgi:uncharacterized membrane protein